MTKTFGSEERLSSQPEIAQNLISSQTPSSQFQGCVQPLASGWQIVHATNGRVRIRPTDTTDSSFKLELDSLSKQLKHLEGVKTVTVNQETGSLIVNFAAERLSLAQILLSLQEMGISPPQANSSSASKPDAFAAWKSLDYWKEQGISLIPLFTGLFVTGRLGISGWASIPIYLLTADATRLLIAAVLPQLVEGEDGEKEDKQGSREQEAGSRKQGSREQGAGREFSPLPPANSPSASANLQSPNSIYKLVHTIPGRVRFNVPRIAEDYAYARRLERILKTDAQVTGVRINRNAASVMISFEPQPEAKNIPVSYWVDVIQLASEAIAPTNVTSTNETPATNNLTNTTTEKTFSDEQIQSKVQIEANSATVQSTSPTTSLWSEMKLPSLSISLAVMANLIL
jgi:copper chaperone CopZ